MMKKRKVPLFFLKGVGLGLFLLGFIFFFFFQFFFSYHIDFKQGSRLDVEISTPHLKLRSICHQDVSSLTPLFKTPEIMRTLSDTEAFSPQMIDYILYRRWIYKWEHHIPYSGFAVFESKTGEFVGFSRVERTSLNTAPGQVEIAYAVLVPFQGRGYATEIVKALIYYYIPYLQKEGLSDVEGGPLREVIGTVQETNYASLRVLEKNGFEVYGKVGGNLKLRKNF